MSGSIAKPLANYAPYRRAGDLVYFAGVVPADPDLGRVVSRYSDLPEDVARMLGATGEMSVDSKDGPITVQSWFVLDRLRSTVAEAGGTLADVVKLTQFFCDLRDFPIYNRIRTSFFGDTPPASTVVRVVELLPTPETRLEVEAIAYIPEKRSRD
jgi:enamine deaminase RidA (YjgF/YER057c/UK114 family)